MMYSNLHCKNFLSLKDKNQTIQNIRKNISLKLFKFAFVISHFIFICSFKNGFSSSAICLSKLTAIDSHITTRASHYT